LLSAAALWLSIRQIDWGTLRNALVSPDWPLLAVALGTVLATTVAKSARWRVLLRQVGAAASGIRLLRVLLIGQMGNIFLPARMGDLARAALIGPQTQGGFAAVLGTIVVEKALDGWMGLLILIGLALWTPLPGWLRGPVLVLALFTGTLLLLLVLAAARQAWAGRIYVAATGWLPDGVQGELHRQLARFALGLGLFRQPAYAFRALYWSVVVWGLAALTNTVTMAALDIEAPGWSTWLVLVTGYVATFLPTVPAQIGVFEYACVLALTAAGVAPELALAFGLVLHLLVYAPPAILGLVAMAVEGFTWSGLSQDRSQYQEGKGALT
jgi:hypothetical protein